MVTATTTTKCFTMTAAPAMRSSGRGRLRLRRLFQFAAVLFVMTVFCLSGCVQDGLEAAYQPRSLDFEYFRCNVNPVLMTRCSFPACHGSEKRPFRVYTPRRLRRSGSTGTTLSDEEILANYNTAAGYSGNENNPNLLLYKPLAISDGGYFHRAKGMFRGGDVFLTTADPGYTMLSSWTEAGATAAPGCTPIVEVGQ